jgi:hypothetical protein
MDLFLGPNCDSVRLPGLGLSREIDQFTWLLPSRKLLTLRIRCIHCIDMLFGSCQGQALVGHAKNSGDLGIRSMHLTRAVILGHFKEYFSLLLGACHMQE